MKDENTQNKYFRIEEKLEAIIFLSKEMLKIDKLASFYDIEKKELEKILLNLKEKRKDSGINLRIEDDVVYFVSNPLFGLDIKKFFKNNQLFCNNSIISTFITAFWLKNLTLTVLSIVFLLALRSIMAELILSKKITISVKKDISTELMMTFIFITVSWFLPVPLGFTVYFIVYLIYFVKKYTNIKDFKKIIIDL